MRSKIDMAKGILLIGALFAYMYMTVSVICIDKREAADTLIQMMRSLK